MQIVPKLTIPDNNISKGIIKMRDEMRIEIAKEYEKTIYIMQFLTCDERDIATKIRENEYGLKEEDFASMLFIPNYFVPK